MPNTTWTAKTGDFEVADSSGGFCGIGHFLEESAIFYYIMYIKDWRIDHFLEESARDTLSIRKRNWPLQNLLFNWYLTIIHKYLLSWCKHSR